MQTEPKTRNKTVLAQLLKLQKAASFENAHFGCIHGPNGGDIESDQIKEKTRIYMDTWVRPLISELIEFERGKIRSDQLIAKRFPY